jgi:nitrous oxidase accessory protein NosD
MPTATTLLRSLVAASATLAASYTGEANAKTVHVTPDTLQNALLSAVGGDRIVLAPGQYGNVTWARRTFKPAVTIDAAQAQFTYLSIRDVDGMILNGGTVIGPRTQTMAVSVKTSRHIILRGMHVSGARIGITLASGQDLVVEHNEFDGIRSDGINIAAVQRAKILYNDCRNFTPVRGVYDAQGKSLQEGDHPDCIQGWAVTGQPPPSDIEIIGNTAHGMMQGIFFGDGVRGGADRLVVRGNTLEVAMYHGILLDNARDSVITGNTVRAVPGARMLTYPFHPVTPWIRATNSQRTLICGNTIETPKASQDIGACPVPLKLTPMPKP